MGGAMMNFTDQKVSVDNTRPAPGPTPPTPQFEPISEEEKRVGTEINNFINEYKKVRGIQLSPGFLFTFGNAYVD
jgi:hypothetical protein